MAQVQMKFAILRVILQEFAKIAFRRSILLGKELAFRPIGQLGRGWLRTAPTGCHQKRHEAHPHAARAATSSVKHCLPPSARSARRPSPQQKKWNPVNQPVEYGDQTCKGARRV